MILYERVSWLSMIVRVQGSVVSRIWPRFVVTTAVSSVFTWLQRDPRFHFSLTVTPFVITGLPLGIILGFRNSASYDRFWDGRKLWGTLVNGSRTLVRQLDSYVAIDADDAAADVRAWRRDTAYRLVAFSHALCMHLRRAHDPETLRPLLPAAEVEALASEASPPAALVHRLGADVRTALQRGWVNPLHVPMFEATLVSLTDVVGGCERIKNTPTPISYLIFIHRAVALYCLLLPFGLVDTVQVFTPLVVFFISYALFSLDAIGDELDDPFRAGANALPIASIARNVEIYVRRRLGETDLPAPLPPIDGVML